MSKFQEKVFTSEFEKYIEECIRSTQGLKHSKSISAFMAYVSQRFLWNISDVFWRDANRHLYEAAVCTTSQWKSLNAISLIENGIKPTADHPYCPSSCYARYVYAFWEVYRDYFEFFKVWLTMSQTIAVSKLENDLLSCFTFSIDGKVMVACTLDQRYPLLNIMTKKDGEGTSIDFPLPIDSEYLSYEKKNMLDSSLMPKAIEKMKKKLTEQKKDPKNTDRPVILEQIENMSIIIEKLT